MNNLKLLIVTFALLALSGCISYTSNKEETVSPGPSSSAVTDELVASAE